MCVESERSIPGLTSGCASLPVEQEEDVIGVLSSSDKIAELRPLGDRILIKVRGPGREEPRGNDRR